MRIAAITGADLLFAVEGHMERTRLYGPDPIKRIIESLHVDADELQACIQALQQHRPGAADVPEFSAGIVDGFVLGVRAARRAQERTMEAA